jgi:hypothetical protein
MCLAPSICSLDLDFFDESTTANNFAQIQNQYLLPMSLWNLPFGTGHAGYSEIGLLMLIETS